MSIWLILMIFCGCIDVTLCRRQKYRPPFVTNSSLPRPNIENCTKYDNIDFIPLEYVDQGRKPVLLLSFPGSGNTWSRMLLEYASGYFTGSIYNDTSLANSLRAENTCGLRMTAIKGHTGDFTIDEKNRALRFLGTAFRNKCRKGVIFDFRRIILLVRDPYAAVLSEYHRQITQDHAGIIDQLNVSQWYSHARNLSMVLHYETKSVVLPLLRLIEPINLHIVHYEHLLDKSKRLETLRNMTHFAGFVTGSQERLECAFKLAEKSNIHRKSSYTKEMMFQSKPNMVCDLWDYLAPFGNAFGYRPFNGATCVAKPVEVNTLPWFPNIVTKKATLNNSNIKPLIGGLVPSKANPALGSGCMSYSKTEYIPFDLVYQGRQPVLLLSFPGSGNTWSRLLLEYATGYYTGSIYDDPVLKDALRGESTCGLRTVAIKGHTADFIIDEKNKQLRFRHSKYRNKCRKGVIYGFKKIILVVRDPYRALFSEYQRHATHDHAASVVVNKRFKPSRWYFTAMNTSQILKEDTDTLVLPILKHFTPENLMVVKYEELVNKTKQLDILGAMTKFTDFELPSKERLQCAFQLADKPEVHRKPRGSMEYFYGMYPNMICELWENSKAFSQAFGYPVYNHTVCT